VVVGSLKPKTPSKTRRRRTTTRERKAAPKKIDHQLQERLQS
jgi:hypothetical protein